MLRKVSEFIQVFWFTTFVILAVAWCGHLAGAY
jgi:hypothetical protein